MAFTTTIKRKYFDMKMADLQKQDYFWEFKGEGKFWTKRLINLRVPCDAVFLVGSKPYRFKAVEVKLFNVAELPEPYGMFIREMGFIRCFGIRCVIKNDQTRKETF